MDQGGIRSMKVLCRFHLHGRVVVCLDSGKDYTVDLLSAISMLTDTGKTVTSNMLWSSFRHIEFTHDDAPAIVAQDPVIDALSSCTEDLIDNLCNAGFAVLASVTLKKFTNVDSGP